MAKRQASGKSRRARLGREEITQLALDRYAGYLKDGVRTPFEELRARFKDVRVNDQAIARYIMRAFKKRWVEVVPCPASVGIKRVSRSATLEKQLRETYGKYLTTPIVVSGIRPDQFSAQISGPFYQALGQAMAVCIATENSIIRHGDIWGIGSGRAVYNTVKALGTYRPLAKELQLVSLAGTAWSVVETSPRGVDADFNVMLLRESCSGATARYNGCRLVDVEDGSAAAQPIIGSFAASVPDAPPRFSALVPNVALVGVGCLREGHRFWPDDRGLDPLLRSLEGEFRDLVKLIENKVRPDYSPVAEISSHLIFVPDPTMKPSSNDANAKVIEPAISALNKKLLCVSTAQLDAIRSIALVAGQPYKIHAIHHLLTKYHVSAICTDSNTAEKLLALARRVKG